MDPPTHGLLGAVIGQAFFARTLGRRALGWGAALNMLPDVDVVVIPALGGLAEWRYHRVATHSLLALPLAAAAIGFLLARRRGGRTASWIALAVVALLAHPLADAFTSYGTLLLWPSPRRFAWDAVPIVDVFFSGALLLALLAGWIWRQRARLAAGAAVAALAFVVAYDAYGLHLNGRAEAEARRQVAAAGGRPDRVRAYPVLLLPWLRRVVVHEGDEVSVGWVSTWAPAPIRWHTFPLRLQHPAVARARELEPVRMFEWFAMGQVSGRWRPQGAETVVELDDLRYGFPGDPERGLWGVRVRFDADGRPLDEVERVQRPRPDASRMARWLWRATFEGRTALARTAG